MQIHGITSQFLFYSHSLLPAMIVINTYIHPNKYFLYLCSYINDFYWVYTKINDYYLILSRFLLRTTIIIEIWCIVAVIIEFDVLINDDHLVLCIYEQLLISFPCFETVVLMFSGVLTVTFIETDWYYPIFCLHARSYSFAFCVYIIYNIYY
jgi:hypothetical protein